MKRNMLILFAVVYCAVQLGCGPTPPPTVPASGIVTMDGKPLDGAAISLMSDKGVMALGQTDANGKFTLKTAIGSNTYDGAIAGSHKVGISKTANDGKADDDGSKPATTDPQQMASRMGGMATSTVKVTYIVPQRFGSPATSGLTLDIPAGGSDALKIDFKSK